MVSGSVKLSFKQTKAEFMVRVASTLLFNQLVKANSSIVSVREIAENIQYGYTEKATQAEIGPKYVRITDLKDGRVNWETVPYCKCDDPEQYLLKQNDLIFARTGATTGKTHLFRETPPSAVFASYLIRVRPTKEINPEYLYFFFQSDLYWSQVSGHKEGSAQPNVNGQKLSNIEFPVTDERTQKAICNFLSIVRARQDGFAQELPELPFPLYEQRAMVERVETLAARIAKVQSLREKAITEANAILHSAQNQSIGSEPKAEWVSLRYYVAEIRNGKSPDCEKRPAKPDEWGVLKVGAVSFGVFDETENKALPISIEPNPDYEVKAGDFLMIRANTKELVGACAIVEKTRPQLLISDKTFRFVFRKDNIIEPRYLNHVLKSPALRTQIEQQASGTSPTMKNISKEKVFELKVPRTPLDEQRRIVAYLDSVQARLASLRELQSTTGEELDALLPSVLDRAFKGEL